MKKGLNRSQLALAVASAIGATAVVNITAPGLADADTIARGTYVTGDFHNHTTCSDGSISMQKLLAKSVTDVPWGLDWFVQAGHGQNASRNCTLAEDATLATPAYPLVFATDGVTLQGPNTSWANTNVSQPIVNKGDPTGGLWKWQAMQEFQYPLQEYLAAYTDRPLFMGLESNAHGHEHVSMSVITGQVPASVYEAPLPTSAGYTALGNANALSQWTYCFERATTSDNSRGGVANGWQCQVPGSLNEADPSWDLVGAKLDPAGGTGSGNRGHAKTVEAMNWMDEFHPEASYYVPAHLERAGVFNPNGNNGFNIEHLRNFNNAAPTVAFGMETQPGHGASDARGEYNIRRNNFGGTTGRVDSVGGTTYGGTGVYGAQIGGVWDALLGEGRNWWFFASSDWHNRGNFPADDRRTTQDFLPGEYQRDYVMVGDTGRRWGRHQAPLSPQEIVDGLRTGNSWTDSGQLVDRLVFVACEDTFINDRIGNALIEATALVAAALNTDVSGRNCATMGQKLEVRRGAEIVVAIVVRDPRGRSFSPYTFANPSLAQIGVLQPLDRPVLDHFDVINGNVTGYRNPAIPDTYAGEWPMGWVSGWLNTNTQPSLSIVPDAAKNPSARVIRTYDSYSWRQSHGAASEFKRIVFRMRVNDSQYLRIRGTNLPPSVPWETDANGNPLPDVWTNDASINSNTGPTDVAALTLAEGGNLKIPCTAVGTTEYDGCPSHLGTRPDDGQRYSSYDVAAWADLWFYSNPIFVEVRGSTPVAGVD